MSNYHKPKKPTPQQMALMKDRYEVSGAGLVVKTKYTPSLEVGEPVGNVKSKGYLGLKVLGRTSQVHHIVWFLTHERWPERSLDHIDGDRLNNAPENLREVSNSQNQKASLKNRGTVGYRGVYLYKRTAKYTAKAYSVRGKRTHIGYYDTPEEAAIARDLKCYREFGYPWEGLNEIGQEYILKHHPDWIKDKM